MSQPAPAAASSDSLPASVTTLLHAFSVEQSLGDDALVTSQQHKVELQDRIRQDALQRREAEAVAAMSAASTASASDSLPPSAPSPALLRQLSLAAASGVISVALKDSLKAELMNARLTSNYSAGAPGGPSIGHEDAAEEAPPAMDLSHIDRAACSALQSEERHAMQAIYDAAVRFGRAASAEGDGGGDRAVAAAAAASAAPSAFVAESKEDLEDVDGADDPSKPFRTVTLRIEPFPASGPERNLVSLTVRFSLPPLYPYVRPSFYIEAVGGRMGEQEALVAGTLVSEALNKLYAVEPAPEPEVRVLLFDLIQVAQDFLVEFQDFCEDASYHSAREEERAQQAAEAWALAVENDAKAKHAQAYLALSDKAKQAEWDRRSYGISRQVKADPKEEAERQGALAALEADKHAYYESKRIASERVLEQAKTLLEAGASVARSSSGTGFVGPVAFRALMPSRTQLLKHITSTDKDLTRSMPRLSQSLRDGVAPFEPIASEFLIYRWMQRRAAMAREGITTKVSIGFHGAHGSQVRDITRSGLAMRDDIVGVRRQKADTPGRGIELSPFLSCAASGGKASIIVCMVLRGRSYGVKNGIFAIDLTPGFDSHHSEGGVAQEDHEGHVWILYDSAAVLPLYLVRNIDAPRQYCSSAFGGADRHVKLMDQTKGKCMKQACECCSDNPNSKNGVQGWCACAPMCDGYCHTCWGWVMIQ